MQYSKTSKDKILYTLFTLRAIPKHDLLYQFNGADGKRINVAINDFKKFKYIRENITINGHRVLYITRKGYEHVVNNVLQTKSPQYTYSTSKSRRSPMYTHHYMNFKYVWDYVHQNWDQILEKKISIFTDQDIVNCKLSTDFEGERLVIRPDVLIRIPVGKQDEDLILVENDTGRENPINIYRKFLQYAMFLLEGKRYLHIKNVQLHFVFLSKKRLHNVFKSDVVVNRFDHDNEYKKWELDMKKIIEAFKSKDFSLYATDFKESKPEKVDFIKTLKLTKHSWKHYLS